jgi:uncharacterized protein
MKKRLRLITKLSIVAIIFFTINACSSSTTPKTNFYVLTQSIESNVQQKNNYINVEAVAIPSYLQQRGIALVVAPYQIEYAHFHRWAEPLESGIQRAFSYALAQTTMAPLIDKAALNIRQFHGTINGQVLLDADWNIKFSCAEKNYGGHFTEMAQQASSGYGDLVAAHKVLIVTMSTQIDQLLISQLPESCKK